MLEKCLKYVFGKEDIYTCDLGRVKEDDKREKHVQPVFGRMGGLLSQIRGKKSFQTEGQVCMKI